MTIPDSFSASRNRTTLPPFRPSGWTEPSAASLAPDRHFASVYLRYYPRIHRICSRYSTRWEEASDLAHDVFVRYFQNIDRFRNEASPSTWMYRVAVNLGIQKWRRERDRIHPDHEMDSIPCEGGGEEEMLDRISLAKILAQYPERTRKIVFLHHVENVSQIEIGKTLGISRATVIRHLIHFKHTCRGRLERAVPAAG